jgi:hypothetical protein
MVDRVMGGILLVAECRRFAGGRGLSCCNVPAFPQFARLLHNMVRNRCGASPCFSAGRLGDVELGHEFAVGGAGGGEVLVALFELQP